MRITDIDAIPVEVPYHERIREYLRKGWGFANRATDQEFKEHREVFEAEWSRSTPPIVDVCIYKVHTDEGPVGLAEGARISPERLATYRDRLAGVRRRLADAAPRTPVMKILRADRERSR